MRKGETVRLIRKGCVIKYIKPCNGEKGKVMAEVTFSPGKALEPREMRERLGRVFRDAKCIPSLGMVRIMHGGMAIMVFVSGKIDIRRAGSMEEVLETAEKIMGAVSG